MKKETQIWWVPVEGMNPPLIEGIQIDEGNIIDAQGSIYTGLRH